MHGIPDSDIETHCARLDADHRDVLRLFGALQAAVEDGERGKVRATLDAAADRVRRHFELEQSLMKQVGHAKAAEHLEAHAAFLADLARFQKELARRGVTDGLRQWAFGRLVSWFRLHIRTCDIDLAREVLAYEKSRGPAPRR